MYILTPLTFLLLLALLSSSSLGAEITLSSVTDFTDFVSNVSSGNQYSEDTVYLGSDITLTGSIDPIGNSTYQFRGVFDGQGHIISNLNISSSSKFTGLFGYSTGLTIKNVVLDSSCVIESTPSGYDTYIGGIIGYCWASNGECNIENSVNMADVTFSGRINSNLLIGGVAGYLSSPSSGPSPTILSPTTPASLSSSSSPCYDSYVKNCANYGSVTHSGTTSSADLGGIIGFSQGSQSYYKYSYIQNCINYGTISHSGKTSSDLSIGGIVGSCGYYTYVENCVSAGKISTPTTASSNNHIGSIMGEVVSHNIYINYCYYTNDVNASSINGYGTPSSTTGTPDTPTSVDSEFVNKLDSNATSCGWDKWFMLHLNGGSINNLTKEPLIGIQKALPNPVKEENSFLFWCKDAECTEEFDTESASEITDLYAAWVNNTVTFDFDNGTTVNVTFTYNTEIIYPEDKKEGYTLSWDNYHELMAARDITVTAQWSPNNYTVTFDATGGSVSETSKIVTFNKKYGNLPEPKKEGYMFLGWFTNETNGAKVTNETIATTPNNHTLYAHWEEVTTYVEIVFNKKDLTEEEAKNIVKQYTNADFTIEKFENESGETKIIIKFVEEKDAVEIVRNIKGSYSAASSIKGVGFDKGNYDSVSEMVYPLTLFGILFL